MTTKWVQHLGRYFNKGVKSLDNPHIGFVVRKTDDKIVVFGDGKIRYYIPLSEIRTTEKNVLIGRNLKGNRNDVQSG